MADEQFVYQLYYPNESEHVVEVFDCYDHRYGNIFFKGEFIAEFYKESYDEVLNNYKVVREMQKMGLDVEKAKVLVYYLEPLRDYESQMTVMDFELVVDYSYDELLTGFIADKANIDAAVQDYKKKNSWYQFIEVDKLDV